MSLRIAPAVLAWCCLTLAASAADYQVETLDSPPPTDGVAPAVLDQLSTTGFKVVSGKRTICEIWPCKTWAVQPDFKPSASVIYPFEFGQLVGLMRYPRKGGDFRGQEIKKGVYTLRYGLQPQDGNHTGTSDTRDFLLLVPVADDTDPKPLDKKTLFALSPKAAGTTHPSMLCLLAAGGESSEKPEIKHDEQHDRWSVRFTNASAGGKSQQLTVELVVVGKFAE